MIGNHRAAETWINVKLCAISQLAHSRGAVPQFVPAASPSEHGLFCCAVASKSAASESSRPRSYRWRCPWCPPAARSARSSRSRLRIGRSTRARSRDASAVPPCRVKSRSTAGGRTSSDASTSTAIQRIVADRRSASIRPGQIRRLRCRVMVSRNATSGTMLQPSATIGNERCGYTSMRPTLCAWKSGSARLKWLIEEFRPQYSRRPPKAGRAHRNEGSADAESWPRPPAHCWQMSAPAKVT